MNPEPPLVVVVPHVPPVTCGVGDYSARLLEAWRPARALHFLVPQNGDGTVPVSEFLGARVEHFPLRETAISAALAAQSPCDVLLHYSAFGFHPRGYPRALIRSLLSWRATGRGRLVVMFHELWDTSAEGTLRAPLEWLHRRAMRRLACAADAVVTNTTSHLDRLLALDPGLRVQVQPVASNIPLLSSPPVRSPGTALIFGMQGSRVRTMEAMGADLRELLERGRLCRMVLAGGGAHPRWNAREEECIARFLPAASVERHGRIPAEEIAALLAQAEFGLCETEWKDWGKSTVFMTYAAHGLNILSPHGGTSREVPFRWLTRPHELLDPAGPDAAALHTRAAELHDWYDRAGGWDGLSETFREALSAGAVP